MSRVRGKRITREELQRSLRALELQFGMSSQQFYRRYERGQLPHRREFTRWASLYALLTPEPIAAEGEVE